MGLILSYQYDWSVVPQYAGLMLRGLKTTFTVSLSAEALGLGLGLIFGIGRMSKTFVWRLPSTLFVDVFRSIPVLVLLIWIYYGVAFTLGLNLSVFEAGVLTLGLIYASNLAEVFRSGLQSVHPGQAEAAYTLGLNRWHTMRRVVVPQAVRTVLPALANSYVAMLKDSTLVSVIGLAEFMRVSEDVVAQTFRPFEIYTFVAVVYFLLVFLFGRLVSVVERLAPIR